MAASNSSGHQTLHMLPVHIPVKLVIHIHDHTLNIAGGINHY